MMTILPLVFLLGYFAVILLVAKLFSRQIRDLKDYFLAGRSLGSWPVALSFAASWFGAASTMGSINAFHDHGLSGAWMLVFPSVLSFVVITFFMARRVARQSFLSQPEAVEAHYGRPGRLLLAVVILCATTTLIGSQMVAAGQIFQNVFGVDITWATIFSTLVVVSYAMWGGYFTVVVTDMVQVLFIVLSFLILLVFMLGQAVPDAAAWQHFITAQPPHFWDFFQDWQKNSFLVLTFVLAWCIAPEMWQRMSSTRNEDLAFQASCRATYVMLGLFSLIVAIGLLSTQIVGKSETVLVDLAMSMPQRALGLFVLLGFVAAVTSTMDSAMNVGSLTLTRDLYQSFLRPQAGMGELLWVGRLSTVLVVIPAMVIALAYQDIIQILWISADIYASCMFFPVVGLLYLRQPRRWSGVLAMILGGLSVAFSALVQNQLIASPFPWPGWPYSTLISVSLSGVGFALGYALSPAPRAEAKGETVQPGAEILAEPV